MCDHMPQKTKKNNVLAAELLALCAINNFGQFDAASLAVQRFRMFDTVSGTAAGEKTIDETKTFEPKQLRIENDEDAENGDRRHKRR